MLAWRPDMLHAGSAVWHLAARQKHVLGSARCSVCVWNIFVTQSTVYCYYCIIICFSRIALKLLQHSGHPHNLTFTFVFLIYSISLRSACFTNCDSCFRSFLIIYFPTDAIQMFLVSAVSTHPIQPLHPNTRSKQQISITSRTIRAVEPFWVFSPWL